MREGGGAHSNARGLHNMHVQSMLCDTYQYMPKKLLFCCLETFQSPATVLAATDPVFSVPKAS